MKTIAFVVAMQSEFDLVMGFLEKPCIVNLNKFHAVEGFKGDTKVILMKLGIGKVNAALGVSELIRYYSPTYIVNTGVAGGIGAGVKQGDIIVADKCCYHDVWCGSGSYGQVQDFPLYYSSNNNLLDIIRNIDNDRIKVGLICTGDQFISDVYKVQLICNYFPDALAVDMESAACAQTCFIFDIPFISIRIISDTPLSHDDNFVQYEEFFKTAPKKTFSIIVALLNAIK